uniref:hypothetical protein n=1 Tax=Cedecea sp. VD20 TaxID=3081241 RepID=UPI003019F51F
RYFFSSASGLLHHGSVLKYHRPADSRQKTLLLLLPCLSRMQGKYEQHAIVSRKYLTGMKIKEMQEELSG